MSLLSDKGTRAFKFWFVGSLATAVVAIALSVSVFSEPRPDPLTIAFVMLGSLMATAWAVRRDPWALADEVLDEGSFLVVRRRSVQARVAFDDIAEVDRYATNYARHVRLTLARPVPPFGTKIVFRPRDHASMTTQQLYSLFEELRARAPKAKSSQYASEPRDSLPTTTAGALAVRTTLLRKRVAIACAGLLMAFAAGNFLLEWNLFAPFDRQFMVGCVAVGAIVIFLRLPTVAEMDGMTDDKIGRKRPGSPPR